MATDRRNHNTVQLITFAIDIEPNAPRKWMTVAVKKGQSVASIAAYRGHPEDARVIADHNGIRSVYSKLGRTKLKVPRDLSTELSFHVMPGDGAPTIRDGYAMIDTVDRPQRTGLTMFNGYNPIALDVPIRFESHYEGGDRPRRGQDRQGKRSGSEIEQDIALLERMAGRGIGSVSGTAPPPIVRVGVRNGPDLIPLIPRSYQWDKDNPYAPVWRINGIDWDENPIRNRAGNRIRQLATVHLLQHTRLTLLQRGAASRTAGKKPPKRKPRVSR
jgi:hypothetical protein